MARLMVCFAGPLFNFILAFFLSIAICHFTYIDQPILTDIMEGGAAEAAGFEPVEITYLRDGKEHTNLHLLESWTSRLVITISVLSVQDVLQGTYG